MIVLTLTRPWLLVGYRALGRKWASSGLVRRIGEAVTRAPAGAAFGRPGAGRRTWGGQTDVGRTDGRGADRRTWGGQTDVGQARRPTPRELRESRRRRGPPGLLPAASIFGPLSIDREDDVSLASLVEADRATHVQPDTVLPRDHHDIVGSHAPRQAVTDLPYVN